MSADERDRPSEAAVREQLREEPGPRASSSPAEGRARERLGERPPEEASAAGADASPDGLSGAAGADAARAEADTPEPGVDTAGVDEASASRGGAAGPGADEASAAPPDPLVEAERRRDEYLELAQRTQADFENFRRRATRDAAAAGARAKAGLVREILPAIDNLERALAASDHGDDSFARGVQMVHEELVAALERNGVAAFEPRGEQFDPTVHEAISTHSADGTEPGVVLEVVEKGYRLDDTVLRPARVVVSA